MNDSADISPKTTQPRPQDRSRARSKWPLVVALALAVAALVHLINVLIKNPIPSTGIPGETIVGPQRVKLQIAGLPRSGEAGAVQDDVSALWLGAMQAIQTGFCSGVEHGGIVLESIPGGRQSVPGVYAVACTSDADTPAKSYMFRKTANGVSSCEDLRACKLATMSEF